MMEDLVGIIIVSVIVIIVVLIVISQVIRAIHAFQRAANPQAGKLLADLAGELLSGDGNARSLDQINSQRPRSVSDMTSVYAPMIARDYPDLNLQQLISAAENKLCSALYAIQEGSAEGVGVQSGNSGYSSEEEKEQNYFLGATPDFAAQIQRQIKSLVSSDQIEYFERVRVHKSGIYSYQKVAGTCEITLQTAIEYLHYIKQNGSVVSGSQQTVEQAKYYLVLIYVQDERLLPSGMINAVGVNCPNCGAPVPGLGHRQCEFCGTAIQTVDIRIWRINKFSEC